MSRICIISTIVLAIIASCGQDKSQNSRYQDQYSKEINTTNGVDADQIREDNPIDGVFNTGEQILMHTPGVLVINTIPLEEDLDTLHIYNLSGEKIALICCIDDCAENGPEIIFIRKNSTPAQIRQYYPDYGIIIFDSFSKEGNGYKVLINGKECIIHHKGKVTNFESWRNHISSCLISTSMSNPLRTGPEISSPLVNVNNYDLVHFVVKQVKGEWIEVVCNIDCEGCPEKINGDFSKYSKDNYHIIKGWLKWRHGNIIIVSLSYRC